MAKRAAPWTGAEIATLQRLYSQQTAAEIGLQLGRSKLAVKRRVSDLNLRKGPAAPAWTDAERECLRRQYRESTARELAELLRRSVLAVKDMTRKLGLEKCTYGPWSADEIHLLRVLHASRSYAEIGRKLGRTPRAVETRALALAGC